MFGIDDFVSYMQIQSASALRQLAQHYPYDSETGAVTLRSHSDVINEHLAAAIQVRIERCVHRSEMIRTPIQRDHVTSQYDKVNKAIATVPPVESKPIPEAISPLTSHASDRGGSLRVVEVLIGRSYPKMGFEHRRFGHRFRRNTGTALFDRPADVHQPQGSHW